MNRPLPWVLFCAMGSAYAQKVAPDPRLGERLDGRTPPSAASSMLRRAGQAALFLPRLGARLLLTPVVAVTEAAEEGHWYSRLYWATTAEDRLSGLRPSLSLESGVNPEVGLRWFDRRSLGPGTLLQLEVAASASLRLVEATVRPHERLTFRAVYHLDEDEVFREASYTEERGAGFVEARLWQSGAWRLAARGGVDARGFGGDFPFVSPEKTQRIIGGARMSYDTVLPNRRFGGGFAACGDVRWAKGLGSDKSHDATLGAGLVVPVALSDRVLVLRAAMVSSRPLGGIEVPFAELPTASGRGGVRALRRGRLRSETILVASTEYRWLLSPWTDAAVFVDAGQAGSDLTLGYGLGFVAYSSGYPYWRRRPVGRVDVAWSDSGVRFLLSAGQGVADAPH